MGKKTSLHDFFVADDLIPHESNTVDLMFLDAAGNMRMHVDIALVIGLGIVHDNLTLVEHPVLIGTCQFLLEILPSLLLFGHPQSVLLSKIAGINIFEKFPLLFARRIFIYKFVVAGSMQC